MGFQPDRPPELARTRASPADAAGPPTADIVSNELAIASVDQEDGVALVVWRPRKNTARRHWCDGAGGQVIRLVDGRIDD